MVSVLQEDSKGNMWIGTRNGGINRYNRDTDSFVHYKHDPDNPFSISCDSIIHIFEDSQGIMWISCRGGGLNRYVHETNRFTHYRHDVENTFSIGSDSCYSIFEDKATNLWISLEHDFENSLDCFDRNKEIFIHYRHDPKNPASLARGDKYFPVFQDEEDFIWIWVYHTHEQISQIDRYDPQTGKFFHYKEDYNNPKTIRGYNFSSFFKDHSGTFWIGTETRGLTKYNPLMQHFKNYKYEAGSINSLSHNRVYTIIESKTQPGAFWIGTIDGLNKYDQRTGIFTHYRYDPKNINSLSSNHITSLLEDNEGLLWIGTNDGELDCYNEKSGHFKHYDCSPESSDKLRIKALCQDSFGSIWMSEGNHGIIRFEKKNNIFSRYLPQLKNPSSLSNYVFCIYEDNKGSLWMGTHEGLYKFNNLDKTFTRYLPGICIQHIHEDVHQNFWLATALDGLGLFHRETGEANFYNQDNGLPTSQVEAIVEDNNGNLWLLTPFGISTFNPQKQVFTNFYIQHGLPSNNFHMCGINSSKPDYHGHKKPI
jgi:ligand-binding sensor domain-containing protein